MNWITGLCSVTYRQLEPREIVKVASSAGLKAIEWGTDVHAPPGDTKRAAQIADMCRDLGITCPTLGSYARATDSEDSQSFAALLDTADAIGAKTIRVWAGKRGFHAANDVERNRVAENIRDYAVAAEANGMKVALEYHNGTLTDCREGALWLLEQVSHPALKTYWQPVPDQTVEDCRADLMAMGNRLAHLHVFFWKGQNQRFPLSDGAGYWSDLLSGISVPAGGHAFLEFVPDDDPGILKREAAVLTALLSRAAREQETI